MQLSFRNELDKIEEINLAEDYTAWGYAFGVLALLTTVLFTAYSFLPF